MECHRRCCPTAAQQLCSPNQQLCASITTQGRLSYRVAVHGTEILGPSRLGLRCADDREFGNNVTLLKAEREDVDTSWVNALGKHHEVRDHHRQLRLILREQGPAADTFSVVFRAFDDGIAFRYELPKRAGAQEFVLAEELTQFAFTVDGRSWAGDHVAVPPTDEDSRGGFVGSQEWEYRQRRLTDLPVHTPTGLPALVDTPAAWVAITEAELVDWSGMWLAREPQAAGSTAVTLPARLAPRLDGHGLVQATLPHASPWPVLMVGQEPGRLVESDIVLNLSSPAKIADTSWIKPGMMSWEMWWSGVGKKDTATMKTFIQFASDMGWAYQLIDGSWYVNRQTPSADITKAVPAEDLPDLLRFAAERHVKLWLWLHWTDVDRNDNYKAAFAQYEQWGIAGVKIDFLDHDDQDMVNWYEKLTRTAAEHHLMINFHGAYKPTGMIRTWPNQITREGVMGNEYNKWSRRVNAEHRVTLPFTRFLAGPGDFTPGGFLNRSPEQFQINVVPTQVLGTRASQLAEFIAYDSPVTCVSDHPDNLRDQPGIDFLRGLPTVWDDTRVLSGTPGEHIVMARRSAADWYLGALNNDYQRVQTVRLDFLGPGNWQMRWWHDARDSGVNAEHIDVEERTVSAATLIDLRLAPGGGAVAHFVRAP